MESRRQQRGAGNLGCIVWVLILALGVLLAVKLIPVKMKSAELYDFMDDVVKFSSGTVTQEQIEKSILEKAHELEIPLDKRNLKVTVSREHVRIEATYTVPVQFPGYTFNWGFHQVIDRPVFII